LTICFLTVTHVAIKMAVQIGFQIFF
jgi:hypothetical protein